MADQAILSIPKLKILIAPPPCRGIDTSAFSKGAALGLPRPLIGIDITPYDTVRQSTFDVDVQGKMADERASGFVYPVPPFFECLRATNNER